MVYMNVLGRSYVLLNDPDDIKVFKYVYLCFDIYNIYATSIY